MGSPILYQNMTRMRQMDQSMRESRAAAYFLTHMERLGVDEPEAREGAAVFRGRADTEIIARRPLARPL